MQEPRNELERTQRGALATCLESLRAVSRQTGRTPSPWVAGFLQGTEHALDAVAAAMEGIGPEEFQNKRGAALIADGWKLGPFNAKTKTSPAACDSDSLSPEMRLETRAIFSVTSGYTFLAMAAIKDRDRGLEVFDHVASRRGYDPQTAMILGVSYHFENPPTMCCEAPSPKFVPNPSPADPIASFLLQDVIDGNAEATAWKETAAQYARNSDYYRGLVVRIGEIIGEESYIGDDGTRADSVLCAKVPELVEHAVKSFRAQTSAPSQYIVSKPASLDALHDAQPDPSVVGTVVGTVDAPRTPVPGDVLYDADHYADADGIARRVRCGRVFFVDGDTVSVGFTERDLGIYAAKDLKLEPVSVVWRMDRPASADIVPEMGHTVAFDGHPERMGYIESVAGDVVCVFPGEEPIFVSSLRLRATSEPDHWTIVAPVCAPPDATERDWGLRPCECGGEHSQAEHEINLSPLDGETAPSSPAEAPSVPVVAPNDLATVETIPAPAEPGFGPEDFRGEDYPSDSPVQPLSPERIAR